MDAAERIDTLFDRVCVRFADRPAVVDGEWTLSYRQLRDRADRLAAHLLDRGVRSGAIVALAARPGGDLVVGMLAVLKAGAGYLVLDPAYPPARIATLLTDSRPDMVVAAPEMLAQVGGFGASVVSLTAGETSAGRARGAGPRPVSSATGADTVAYVIYTSGTTGSPKGVVVEHRHVTRLFGSTAPWFGFDENDVWTLFHSPSFDFSVWEIWGALLHGGCLVVVAPLAKRHPAAFVQVLAEHRVTVLNQTPTAFRLLLDELGPAAELPADLRVVVFGGERLDPTLLAGVMNARQGLQLVNMYGITETTVHTTYRRITAADTTGPVGGGGSPIGVPLPDLTVELVDSDGALVPDGEPGEMWITGAGVARGYLGRADLTAQRFPVLPDGRRAYRSGDRAVRRDGELYYLGRVDDQVKVNGFRIEPGEVEAALRKHPSVADVVVTAVTDEDGRVELVAVVTGDESDEPAASATHDSATHDSPTRDIPLRQHLERLVPAHLRPTRYVFTDHIPITPNGKLDRAAAARQASPPAVATPTRLKETAS